MLGAHGLGGPGVDLLVLSRVADLGPLVAVVDRRVHGRIKIVTVLRVRRLSLTSSSLRAT